MVSSFSQSLSSVAQSCPTLCDPIDRRQHTRLPGPSRSPGVCSNSCPLSHWYYHTISSSAATFSFCLQSFPASESFTMIWFFASGGQSIKASASASLLPMHIQGWFPLGLTGWISLQSKWLSRVFLQHHNLKASILRRSVFFMVQLSHLYMTTGKTITDYMDLCWQSDVYF